MSDNNLAPRKRGAQPNNTNALKHGYYSPRLQSALPDLDLSRDPGLTEEIEMLRSCIRRFFEMSLQVEDLDRFSSILNALSAAVYRLSALLRTQHVLGLGGDSDLRLFLDNLLAEVKDEMNIPQQGPRQ
jgi:hypothetical protein